MSEPTKMVLIIVERDVRENTGNLSTTKRLILHRVYAVVPLSGRQSQAKSTTDP